jgi:branched-chain amino acid transport system substrate-binding protein
MNLKFTALARSTAMKLRIVFLACAAILAGAASAQAQQEVKIGVLDPLSGPTAQIGIDAVAAIRTAVEIVNEGADLPLALAKNKGLSGLGGAKVSLVVVDHQGKPEVGQSETERLITQEKVHAVIGAYFSSVTAAGSQAAERAGIPFVNADSTSPALTQRGLKYFFRTTPTDENFSELMFNFLKDFGDKSGQKFQSVSLFHEDTAYGTDSARAQERLARERGFRVLEKIAYKAQTTSLTAEVQRLKAANADVLMPSSYTSDTFLLLRTAKDLDYNPKLIVAQNAGFTDPTFISTMGRDAEGAITRSPYNSDLESRIPLLPKINAIFKKHSNGRDLSDVPARNFTAIMTLLDAINRAGSTDPEKIRAALAATNIAANQLIVPYRGVKFDATGQNELSRGILMQVQRGKYCTVYPFELSSCQVLYPAPTWAEKAKP